VRLEGSSSELVLYLKHAERGPIPAHKLFRLCARAKNADKARSEYQKDWRACGRMEFAESVAHLTKAAQDFPEFYEALYHIGVAQTSRAIGKRRCPRFKRP